MKGHVFDDGGRVRTHPGARWRIQKESADKPGSVVNSHLSGIVVANDLKQPTRTVRGPHLTGSYLALLQVGFTLPLMLPPTRCALTTPFHPYRQLSLLRRFAFCGTFRRFSPPRRYLAPCPMKPGLSSIQRVYCDCLADSDARVSIVS